MANVIGQRVRRKEDPRFLRGQGRYVDNMALDNALHLTFVRSPIAHARITGIDVSEARALPNTQVFTAADIGLDKNPLPPFLGIDEGMHRPFIASDTVRFAGDIVAAILTDTQAEGADAAELIYVDYEDLPVVLDPREALKDETVLFPDVGTNVCIKIPAQQSDDELFEGCEAVVEGTLVSQRLAASPLEPRASAAMVDENGRLTAWLSTQTPHQDRDGLAMNLGMDPKDVRVVGPDVGGGFGAKGLNVEDILICWFARETGRTVRWVESRSENMVAMNQGRSMVIDFKIGGTREGKIEAYRLNILADAGGYPGLGAFLPNLTAMMASGVYKIPKIGVDITTVTTNKTTIGAFRGAGRPEATQVIERAVDMFAAELGLDPAELRRLNFIQPDEFPFTTASGATYDIGDYEGALDKALEVAGYDDLRAQQQERRDNGDPKQLGIGLSTYVEVTNGLAESEFGAVHIDGDGQAYLRTGSFSHGQGHETTFAMIAAERLGLPVDSVTVIKGDTDQVARGTGTYGSKSTQIGGAAAAQASEELVEKARRLVADLIEANPDDIVLDAQHGRFEVAGAPQSGLSWGELAARLDGDGRLQELSVETDFKADAPSFPFGAHVAVVEVDTETGGVELLRHIAVDDAGTIISPVVADGQVHGGVATGIAQALFEEVMYDSEGNPVTGTFVGYAFPSAAEMPSFERVEMVTETPLNPLGAKGIGESGTIGATPAVHNAVVDALQPFGVKDIDMPANGERVWRALKG
ncbi:MAG TPA: xanthine dehydrogenase family protein molybdopterin-binding subunit [Thermoleophilaceae bacterium]